MRRATSLPSKVRGSTYVQNGTRHRWSNPGTVPAVIAVVLVGARHRDVS
jgi:hypothetical protein